MFATVSSGPGVPCAALGKIDFHFGTRKKVRGKRRWTGTSSSESGMSWKAPGRHGIIRRCLGDRFAREDGVSAKASMVLLLQEVSEV